MDFELVFRRIGSLQLEAAIQIGKRKSSSLKVSSSTGINLFEPKLSRLKKKVTNFTIVSCMYVHEDQHRSLARVKQ
jgi:hypothetical protein